MSTLTDSQAPQALTTHLMTAQHQIVRQLSTYLTSVETLRTICHSLAQFNDIAYAAILSFDQAHTSTILAEYPAQLSQTAPSSSVHSSLAAYTQDNTAPGLLKTRAEAENVLGIHYTHIQALDFQTLLVAPLRVQNDTIGLLLLATNHEAVAFSENAFFIAESIAVQIALALRNTELFSAIQQRANQLEQTAAFGRLITSTFDERKIMQHVSEIVPKLLPCTAMFVILHTLGHVQMRVFDLKPATPPTEYTLPIAGSSVEVIMRQQAPLLMVDLQSSTYTDHKYLVQEKALKSLISVPLLTSQRPLGVISIANNQPHTYTPTDSTMLQQIGTQVAIALENAHLFQSTQQRAALEESLSDITSRLQQQSDLRVMLEQTMHDLGTVLGANRARVQLRMMPHVDTSEEKE